MKKTWIVNEYATDSCDSLCIIMTDYVLLTKTYLQAHFRDPFNFMVQLWTCRKASGVRCSPILVTLSLPVVLDLAPWNL